MSGTAHWIERTDRALRHHAGLPDDPDATRRHTPPDITDTAREAHTQHGFEWYAIPAQELDDRVALRLYPGTGAGLHTPIHGESLFSRLRQGHTTHAGRCVAVERTQKPGYVPGNVQAYGTRYGLNTTSDPLIPYMGEAGFRAQSRYDHNYQTLSRLLRIINDDWASRHWLPKGYRVSICPPVIFNLIGSVFHQEWADSASLELGFYRDAHGNAQCFAVGSDGPGDFSVVHLVETDDEWPLLGFRLALVPEVRPAR